MRRPERRRLTPLLAAAALLVAGAVHAQAPGSAATPKPLPPTANASAPSPAGASGAPPLRTGAASPPAGRLAPPAAAAALALEGLRGGGEAAPLCRAQCAPAFYGCVSDVRLGGGACHAELATCRRGCDDPGATPGRLQSPLPAAGLAPVGALRPLPQGPPAPQ